MQHSLVSEIENVIMKNRKHKRWMQIVSVLACVVVFCTTYALILPAITMTGTTWCGYEAHEHGESCYEKRLICQLSEEGHTHSESCIQTEKQLICGMEDAEIHEHTSECKKIEKKLVCKLEEVAEHTHTDSCKSTKNILSCGLDEVEAHVHDESCYSSEQQLVCTIEEDENHSHSDSCYVTNKVCICGLAEQSGHTHDNSCYTTEESIICGLTEQSGHTHDESCYVTEESIICGMEENTPHVHTDSCYEDVTEYICGLDEADPHEHGDTCYEEECICTMEEHEHVLSCYSNPEADVETAEVWESTLPKELTGIWEDDVIAVAESQLGYTESTDNYIVTEEGKTKGYTRYGAWYGDPYGHWCAMFVSFCLNYADIPTEAISRECNCDQWIVDLKEWDQYQNPDSYVPEKGDLIFFDMSDESYGADHVGLVVEVDEEEGTVKTIEGNSSNKVQYCTYRLDDSDILGYGELPQNPSLQNMATMMLGEEVKERVDFTSYITNASIEDIAAGEESYTGTISIEFSVPREDASENEFVYVLPGEITVSEELIGITQNVYDESQNTLLYTYEFVQNEDGTQSIVIVFDEEYVEQTADDTIVDGLTFTGNIDISNVDDTGNIKIQFTDTVIVSADVSALLVSLLADGVAAGKYGNYSLSYNDVKDAFIRDPAYATYYNADSPLGTAGSFHVVGFGTVTLKTHTNGNILANTLLAGANFGTNRLANELSYIQNYEQVNSTSASSTNHVLVLGDSNEITISGNDDIINVNGQKLDSPYNIILDTDTSSTPFIDLNRVEAEVSGISARLESVSTDSGVITSFEDQNNRYIQLIDPSGIGYYNMSASTLNSYSYNPLNLTGFSEGQNGTLVINVDCTGVTDIRMPQAYIYVDGEKQNTNEVVDFSAGKVVWNFVNAEGVKITTKEMTGMIIALGATVDIDKNLNGTVVAEHVIVSAESHRTDFTGSFDVPEEEDTSIIVRKVDMDNISIYLPEATFSLYEWDADANEYVLVSDDLVTNEDGRLSINSLEFNTAYRLVETTAPKGYILNDTPYEFYISNVDEGQYPKKIPEDFSGETYTSGKVIYFKNEKNTEYDVMALSIEKEWYNIYGDAISRTRSLIAVNLYQLSYLDEEKATDPVTDNLYKAGIIIDSQSGWKVTLDDLPVSGIENIDGEDTTVYYSYYIREPGIRGYSAEYENNNISVTDGTITLKNTGDEEVQETEITIEKKWLDKNNEAIQKDSGDVRVNLYQKVYEDHLCEYQITTREYQSDIVISAENDWKTTIRNLPEYGTEKVDGQYMIVYYTYYVEEVPVDGYTAVYENNDGIYEGTITINNKEDENMTELVVEKQWYDKDNNLIEKSDGSITITLYQKVHTDASYENYISEHMYQSDVVMNAETNWKLTISDLPKSGTESIDGKEMTVYYTYYVKEQSVEGYNTTYENNKGISEGTIIIQNKEIENYSLPETGGIGTTIYVITGIFLVMGSLLYGYNLKHRRKEVKK